MQTELTTILTNQAVLMTKIDHIRELVEKQNGRVGKLETRCDVIEDRVTDGEKADVKNKAWLSGLAAGIGAIAAFSLDKVTDILKGFGS